MIIIWYRPEQNETNETFFATLTEARDFLDLAENLEWKILKIKFNSAEYVVSQ